MSDTIFIEDETLRQGFTQIPNATLRRPDISPGAKLTYMVLLSYGWQEGSCFPGQERMAEDMGVTSRSVRTYLQQLQEAGLVIIKQRGLNQTNVYTLPRFQTGPENISGPDRKKTTHQDRKNFPTNKTQLKEAAGKDSTDTSRKKTKAYNEHQQMERYRKYAEGVGFDFSKGDTPE